MRRAREIEAKIVSLGSEKRGFFACFASKQSSKNRKRNEHEMEQKTKQRKMCLKQNGEENKLLRIQTKGEMKQFFYFRSEKNSFLFVSKREKKTI